VVLLHSKGRDFPETVLSAAPEAFLRHELGHLLDDGVIDRAVWDEYLNALSNYDAMHGMCEDYRAGATIDLLRDSSDADRKIAADLLLLWGKKNPIWDRCASPLGEKCCRIFGLKAGKPMCLVTCELQGRVGIDVWARQMVDSV
jgi:hypothetical protein